MSKEEVNLILSNRNNWPGTFIIYEDLKRERIGLALKCRNGDIKHHTIVIVNDLYYLKSFPFPYLESIVLYYRKHKLNGTKLTCQADWNSYMKPRRSARITQHLMSTILPTNVNNISARDRLLLYKSKSLRL
ncbi:uncharacterized protein LOC111640506 [Centruroides sculpturatus]|nr:uncharacterized protein LOC111640506 [Centruroides sculpturatus]